MKRQGRCAQPQAQAVALNVLISCKYMESFSLNKVAIIVKSGDAAGFKVRLFAERRGKLRVSNPKEALRATKILTVYPTEKRDREPKDAFPSRAH